MSEDYIRRMKFYHHYILELVGTRILSIFQVNLLSLQSWGQGPVQSRVLGGNHLLSINGQGSVNGWDWGWVQPRRLQFTKKLLIQNVGEWILNGGNLIISPFKTKCYMSSQLTRMAPESNVFHTDRCFTHQKFICQHPQNSSPLLQNPSSLSCAKC